MGVYLALARGDETALERAGVQLRAGHHAEALAELDGVGGQASGRAAAQRGRAYLGRRRHEQAATELAEAARRAPNDWLLQRDYAIALQRLGRRAPARARMQRAIALNPRMQLPRGFRAARRQDSSRRR